MEIFKIDLWDDVAELIFDWIQRSQLKGDGKPGWAVNKADLHKQIENEQLNSNSKKHFNIQAVHKGLPGPSIRKRKNENKQTFYETKMKQKCKSHSQKKIRNLSELKFISSYCDGNTFALDTTD